MLISHKVAGIIISKIPKSKRFQLAKIVVSVGIESGSLFKNPELLPENRPATCPLSATFRGALPLMPPCQTIKPTYPAAPIKG